MDEETAHDMAWAGQQGGAQHFGELRSALHHAPGRGAWAAIRSELYAAYRSGDFERVEAYASHHLGSWPDALRRAPDAWCAKLFSGELAATAPLWRMVRRVSLDFLVLAERVKSITPFDTAWMQSPWLDHITRLELSHTGLTNHELSRLAGRFAPGQLEALKLSDNVFGAEGVRALINAPALSALRHLDLRGNSWGGYEEAIAPLSASPQMSALQSLELECDLTREDLSRLLASPRLAKLEHLGLHSSLFAASFDGVEIEEANLSALSESPMRLDALRSLRLSANQLDDERLGELVAIDWMRQIESIDLSWNELGDRAVEALEALGGGLKRLVLRGALLHEQGARELLDGGRFERLEALDVSSSEGLSEAERLSAVPPRLLGVKRSGRFWVDALRDMDGLESAPPLRALNMSDVSLEMSGEEARQLAGGALGARLERLELANCELSVEALGALLHPGRGLGSLKLLNLNRNELAGAWFERAVARGTALPRALQELRLRECDIEERDVVALCERPSWPWPGLQVLDLRGHFFAPYVTEALDRLAASARCDLLY